MDIRWRREAISDHFLFRQTNTSKALGDLRTATKSKNPKIKKSTKNIKKSSM